MRIFRTPEHYHALAKERDFEWIGSEVPNTKTKTLWRCAQGHEFYAKYNNLQSRGLGCPVCSGRDRKTPSHYHALAQERGVIWLGQEVGTTHEPTNWRCPQGHEWEGTYANLKGAKGCPKCAPNARVSESEFRALAVSKGFIVLGFSKDKRGQKVALLRCECGKEWHINHARLKDISDCPRCSKQLAGKRRRYTTQDYHSLATSVDITWIGGDLPILTADKTLWRCANGHDFEASYATIRGGHGCPTCARKSSADKRRLSCTDYRNVGTKRDITWIGATLPLRVTEKTLWRCPKGHEWEASYTSLQAGHGCIVCSGLLRKTPQDFHALASQRGIVWLGSEVENSKTKTRWQCSQGHTWLATFNIILKSKHGCPYCAGNAPLTAGDYAALADERGLIWLGAMVKNIQTPTSWQCLEGHVFSSRYGEVYMNRGCPICAGHYERTESDYRTLGEKHGVRWTGDSVPPRVDDLTTWECERGHEWRVSFRVLSKNKYGCIHCNGIRGKSAEHYLAIAAERGITWIGDLPKTGQAKTRWRCPVGHEWEAKYGGILRGALCPHCAGNIRKAPSDYHALAAFRGYEWVGVEALNVMTRTTWRCSKGHEWETTYNTIQRGSGCPFCQDMVNGAAVSKPQRRLHEMLGGDLNRPVNKYRIDIALSINGVNIAVEYDCAFWHDAERDKKRDAYLLKQHWRILRIKSSTQLPPTEQLNEAIERLSRGESYIEITLSDWKGD